MYFKKYKPSFGSDRIAIAIGPDTYNHVFMETALLRPDTRDFLDKYGYVNQDTKEWISIDLLLEEINRIVNIYIQCA